MRRCILVTGGVRLVLDRPLRDPRLHLRGPTSRFLTGMAADPTCEAIFGETSASADNKVFVTGEIRVDVIPSITNITQQSRTHAPYTVCSARAIHRSPGQFDSFHIRQSDSAYERSPAVNSAVAVR